MIIKNKWIIPVAIVAILLIAMYAGVLPGLSILDNGTTTINKDCGGIKGSGELIGPNARKGFITSWKNDGFSETITCIGKVHVDTFATGGIDRFAYEVYGKKQGGNYEPLSTPSATSMYISNPNPGVIDIPGTISLGGTYNMDAYSFEFVGNDYVAVKVIFKGYIDWNLLNPFDDGWQWRTLSTDEAYLYMGYGSLTLPFGSDNRPRDSFELGEVVDIRVETAKGGQTVEGTGSWRVTLNEPFLDGITTPGTGGGVIKEESYNDDTTNGHFKFIVTESMVTKSMSSDDPYSIRIWNTILPMGTLYVDFLDFTASCPGDVEFSGGPIQSKVGESVSVTLNAEVNPDLPIAIDYFRVSVIYGTNNVLLPSDPTSLNWIIHTTNWPASGGKATVTFTPEKESYCTVHATAFDTEGRGGIRTRTWTLWAYADNPAPDDVVDDETGDNDYSGGHTNPWLSWDPSAGNWPDPGTPGWIVAILGAIIVFIVFLLISFMPSIQPQARLIIVILGAGAAIALWWFLMGIL